MGEGLGQHAIGNSGKNGKRLVVDGVERVQSEAGELTLGMGERKTWWVRHARFVVEHMIRFRSKRWVYIWWRMKHECACHNGVCVLSHGHFSNIVRSIRGFRRTPLLGVCV